MSEVVPWSSYERAALTDYTREIQDYWASANEKIIVLDDDPTGCQSVHDIPVYLHWDRDTIYEALQSESKVIFILTNIRSLSLVEAQRLHQEVADLLLQTSKKLGITVRVVSRSDSTLRGHFPEDLEPFFRTQNVDGILIIPAFFEGGRYTYLGTHYVKTKDGVVPAHKTEFAMDSTFGFQTAFLPDWIRDKWNKINKVDVSLLDIETIRKGGVEGISDVLSRLQRMHILTVDALDSGDLQQLSLAVVRRQQAGQSFLFRSAASFVQSYAGISNQNLLKANQIARPQKSGGLVVVGSYVQKTSEQLEHLLKLDNIIGIELSVEALMNESGVAQIQAAVQEIDQYLRDDKDVVCYTSRDLVHGSSSGENLKIGKTISEALVNIIQEITVMPSFLISKGGITSHVIAQSGLSVKRAWVLGQAHPGVPVWETDEGSKWPGLRYVVFPGNVGDESALAELVEKLQHSRVK